MKDLRERLLAAANAAEAHSFPATASVIREAYEALSAVASPPVVEGVVGYIDPEAAFLLPRPDACVLSAHFDLLLVRDPHGKYTMPLYASPVAAQPEGGEAVVVQVRGRAKRKTGEWGEWGQWHESSAEVVENLRVTGRSPDFYEVRYLYTSPAPAQPEGGGGPAFTTSTPSDESAPSLSAKGAFDGGVEVTQPYKGNHHFPPVPPLRRPAPAQQQD